MALQLEKLIFDVDTTKLQAAQKEVENLAKTVQDFNRTKAASERESAKAAKEAEKATKEVQKAQQASADATDAVTNKIIKLNDTLSFLRNDLKLSETGFTKSQAGVLAWAKGLDASSDSMKELAGIFDNFNRIMGEQALDKSVAGFNMINRQIKELQITAELTANGFNLTAAQVKQLTRDMEALKQANIALGREANAGIDELKTQYVTAANALNQQIALSKEMEAQAKRQADAQAKAARDMNSEAVELFRQHKAMQEKMQREGTMMSGPVAQFRQLEAKKEAAAAREIAEARKYMIRETESLIFVNEKLAEGFTVASANALFRYKEKLEQIGLSADKVQAELKDLGAELMKKQQTSPFAKMQKDVEHLDNSVNHLSRNLSVQFTDIFVSLASGQSLFQVITQQGGQIADAFRLAGAEMMTSGQQAAILAQGLTQILDTYKAIGQAFGVLVLDAFKNFASSIATLVGQPISGLISSLKHLTGQTSAVEQPMDAAASQFKKLSALATMQKFAMFSAAAAVIALAAAYVSVTEENKKLNRELVLNGASLGLTTDKALELAGSFREVGKNASEGKEILGLMAKEGKFTSEQFEQIGVTISDFAKYSGIALDEVVKKFAEVNKDPVKALSDLQIATGRVSVEIQKQVNQLVEQGDKTAAAKKAMTEFNRAIKESAEELKAAMPWYQELWTIFNDLAQFTWDKVKQLVGKDSLENQLKSAKNYLEVIKAQRGDALHYDVLAAQAEVDRLEARIKLGNEAAKQRQENSQEETKRRATEDYLNKLRIESLKPDAKKLSLQNYLNQAVDYELAQRKDISRTDEVVAAIRAKAEDDWIKANESRAKKEQSELKKAKNMYDDIFNVNKDLTKEFNDQVKAFTLLLDNKYITPEEYEQAINYLIQQQPFYKEQLKYAEDLRKTKQKIYEYDVSSAEALRQSREAITTTSQELEFQQSILGKTEEQVRSMTIEYEKQKAVRTAMLKAETDLLKAKKDRDNQLLDAFSEDKLDNDVLSRIDATYVKNRTEILKQLSDTRVNIEQDANLKISQDYHKQFKEVSEGISEAMILALGGKGKEAGKKLRDMLKAQLMKPITVVVNAVVNTVFGGAIEGLLGAVGITKQGGAGGLSNIAGAIQTVGSVNTLYEMATMSYAAKMSSNADKLLKSSFGEKLGLSQTGTQGVPVMQIDPTTGVKTAVPQTDLTKLGSTVKDIGIRMISTVVGQALRKTIAGGYKLGRAGETLLDIAGIVGGFGQNPITGLVVGVVSGLISRTFGRKLTQAGIMGTFGGEAGFTGSQYTFEKGGLLRSNKTKTFALDQSVADSLTAQFRAIQLGTATLATSLGLGTKSIEDYTYKMKVNLKDLSDIEAGKKIGEEFTKMQEKMSEAVLKDWSKGDSWKGLLKESETASKLLERLSNTLGSVNGILDTLGFTLLKLSMDSAVAATALTDAFGGVDKFTSSMSFFYENFYSQEERTATTLRQLTTAFKNLGFQLPKTTAEFRKLMEDAIGSGNYGLAASLAGLQQSFIDLTKASSEATNSLLEEINRLRAANVTDPVNASGLQSEFSNLTTMARAGDLSAIAKLPGVSQAIEADMQNFAANASDVVFARAWLAQSLQDTMSVLDGSAAAGSVMNTAGTISGSPIATTASTAGSSIATATMSQTDLIAALIAEVQLLRAEVRADVDANSKSARILDRAMQDGESLNVTVLV